MNASQKSAFLDSSAKYGYALVLWWVTLSIMFFLDGKVELGSLAMVLVLSAALSGLLMPPILSMGTCAAAVPGLMSRLRLQVMEEKLKRQILEKAMMPINEKDSL
jgi:hypothetical protein